MRYFVSSTGENWVGDADDVTFEAQASLWSMAVGRTGGPLGPFMYTDENDPTVVSLDIRKQGDPEQPPLPGLKPWGYR
jgi:hypothetical protein